MIKVIALDPGVTTGWAEGIIEDGHMQVRCGQDALDHLAMYDWLTIRHMNYIVCEDFVFIKGKQGVNYTPVELIGIVKLFIQQTVLEDKDPVTLFIQSPAIQGDKAFWTDQKLKDNNVYEAGKPHGRSALKHLLHWYMFAYGSQFNTKGFGSWQQ